MNDDDHRLPAMWKLFLSIMATGGIMGIASPLVAFGFERPWHGPRMPFIAMSVATGFTYALFMYIFVKSMLRAFVRKLHTLERVVAGITPPVLPSVWTSNEIDEVEKSAARIIAKLDAARAEAES